MEGAFQDHNLRIGNAFIVAVAPCHLDGRLVRLCSRVAKEDSFHAGELIEFGSQPLLLCNTVKIGGV